jgi:hypothetical protein
MTLSVKLFAFCDYAASDGFKLTLAGIFTRVLAPQMPVQMPSLGFGMMLRSDESLEGNHRFRARMISPSKATVVSAEGGVKSGPDSTELVLAVNLRNIELREFGDYGFEVMFDDLVYQTSLPIVQRAPVAGPSERLSSK